MVKKPEELKLWHWRLGHASEEKMKLVNCCYDKMEFCDSCNKAKHTRLPFGDSSIKSSFCFDLIHCDVWGPYRIPSITGLQASLYIVSDFSRVTWVYMMKHKSEVSKLLISFLNMSETPFNGKVKQIRTDNGTEFKSLELLKFYEDKGMDNDANILRLHTATKRCG